MGYWYGIVTGQNTIILTELLPLFVLEKWFLACNSFTVYDTSMKFHRYASHQRLHITNKNCHSDLSSSLVTRPWYIWKKIVYDLYFIFYMEYLNGTPHICLTSKVSYYDYLLPLLPFHLMNCLPLLDMCYMGQPSNCNYYQFFIYQLSRMRVIILTDSVPVKIAWLQTLSSRWNYCYWKKNFSLICIPSWL